MVVVSFTFWSRSQLERGGDVIDANADFDWLGLRHSDFVVSDLRRLRDC